MEQKSQVMQNNDQVETEEDDKAIKWTPEQQDAIDDRKHNLLVSASAGSGKTTVMMQRIVNLMIEKELPISRFLVVTFTTASASDMKAKLVNKLLEVKDNAFALSQIENVETSDISNLHSFCSRLVSTYFYEVGVDPAFHIIDEVEATHLKDKALSKLFEKKERDGDLDFFVLFDIFQKKRKDKVLKEVLKKFNNFLNSHIDGETWFKDTIASGYTCDLEKNVCADIINGYVPNQAEKLAKKADAFAEKCILLGSDKLGAHFQDVASILRTINKKNSYLVNAQNVYDIKFDKTPPPAKDQKFLGDEAKKIKDYIKNQINNFKLNYVSNDVNVIYEGMKVTKDRLEKLYALVVEFDEIYSELKKEANGLDFNDLERFALKILSNDAILTAVKNKYEYVFVDEYQDINNVQEKIISLVSGKTNRFMVGDVKQSIYRFRLCDPDIFLQKYDIYGKGQDSGRLIRLNANFRSDKKILKFVDDVFCGVMTEEFGGLNYDPDAVFVPGKNNLDKPNAMNLIYIDTTMPKVQKAEARGVYSVKNHTQEESAEIKAAIAEARVVASKIAELVDKNNPERLPYNKIAILVGAKKNAAVSRFIEVLKSFGVPISSGEKHELINEPHIKEIVNFIKFVCNPKDDFIAFNVLKSKLFDFSDLDLIKIRKLDHKARFFECLDLYESLNDEELKNKIIALKEKTEKFSTLARLVDVKTLAKKIVEEFSLDKINLINHDGEVFNDEIQGFIDALPEVDAFEFILEFDDFSLEFEGDEGGDCVQLMTVHKSKGIEFEAVFVVNTARAFNMKSTQGNILFNKYYGVGLDYYDTVARVEYGSVPISAIRLLERRKLVEEQQRVLYVALTRAIQKMYIVCAKPIDDVEAEFPDRPMAFGDWFGKFIVQGLENKQEPYINFEAYKIADLLDIPKETDKQLILTKADEKEPDWFEYGYGSSVKVPLKNSVSKILKNSQENDDYESQVIFGAENNSSAERGTLYHKVFQNIDLKNLINLDEQFKEIEKLFTEDEWKLINQKLVKDVLKGDFFAKIEQDDIILQEREFYAAVPAGLIDKNATAGDEFMLQGVIDLVVAKPQELWILDYKTGSLDDDKLEKYKFQIETYSSIAEKSFGRKVTKKAICLVDLQKIIEF